MNILGVKLAATFELVVCVLAVAELLVFMGVVAPAFSFSNFALNGWAGSDVFGAIVMYIISMLSLFKLRKTEPNLERTFRAPGYPIVPGIALALAVVCLVAMAWFNTVIGLIFLGFMAIGFVYFQLTASQRAAAPADAMLTGV